MRFLLIAGFGLISYALTGGNHLPSAEDTPPTPIFSTSFTQPHTGEARLRLTAIAPRCDWGKAGAESAVVSVAVDGAPSEEIVLYGGADATTYDTFLGSLTAGKHTLSVTFRSDLSPQGAHGVTVQKAEISAIRETDAREALVWKHVPLIYGRDDNATSDVPLLLFYQVLEEPDAYRIIYSVIFSNEDGGTGDNVGSLVARWGRSTDIEWVYDVTVDKANGTVLKTAIQAAGHRVLPFQGQFRGSHPLLRTSTTNNMVTDGGTSRFLFAPSPVREIHPDKEPREAVMDAFPWSHTITAKEMIRENKWESPPDPSTVRASDIRNYLHLDYKGQFEGGALLAIRVRLKNGTECFSDHGRPTDAIGRNGWVRVTVELPAGTRAGSVAEVGFVRRDDGVGTATVLGARAFFLDATYRPTRPFLVWSGEKSVAKDAPTLLPAGNTR